MTIPATVPADHPLAAAEADAETPRDGTIPNAPFAVKGVRDLLTAIAWGEERKPAHFDCILKDISDKEELLPKEKLIYMGAGSFGIVRFRSGGSNSAPRFVIRKRIQLEEKEEKFEWRRQISRKIR